MSSVPAHPTPQIDDAPQAGAQLRVLMIGPDLQVRGGVSAVARALIAYLPPDIRVTYLPTMVEGSKWAKLSVFLRAFAAAVRQLTLLTPDVVHIHFSSRASSVRKMVLARLALAGGAKVIMHSHGGRYQDYWAGLSRAGKAATLGTLRRVDRLVVLGERWREFFVSLGLPRERIVVLPNPVELPGALPIRLIRSPVRLVYLGLVERSKGVFDLLDALTALPPACRARVKLVIAGNGATAEVRESIEQRGLQQFVEVRDWLGPSERDRLLASSDVFVLPSYAEGLPMALLEAMAWGLPAICTSVGSIAEHVRDGVQGLLVRPGDVTQLAGAIESIVRDDAMRVRMGTLARTAVEPLRVELFAAKVAALYRGAAGKPSLDPTGATCTRS